ncbi:hypothetical protein ACOME3_009991 [Neoechinorhynchus agilis]
MSRPVDAAMIQFDATSHDRPTAYSVQSNTEETHNASGTPGISIVNPIEHSLGSSFNAWYLDEAKLGSDPSVVLRDLETLVRETAGSGVELNAGKCELLVMNIEVELAQSKIIKGSRDEVDRARLLGVSTRESGAWLEALPIASMGPLLVDERSVPQIMSTDLCRTSLPMWNDRGSTGETCSCLHQIRVSSKHSRAKQPVQAGW